jgi:LPXTG-motif cell wall-anchored protein
VFNSFTNAPNYGDERAFFDARDASINTEGGWLDSLNLNQDGQRVTFRVYIHNDANPAEIGVDNATAHNTKVEVFLPTGQKTAAQAAAEISASNANPVHVSDTVDLAGAKPFTIAFDKSAPLTLTYRPNGQGDFVTANVPANMVNFASDNYLTVNFGDWHGCFNYSALMTVTAVVHTQPTTPPPTTPPSTPKTPTSLPNTGAGNVAAVAGGAAILGTALYRRRLTRSLSK